MAFYAIRSDGWMVFLVVTQPSTNHQPLGVQCVCLCVYGYVCVCVCVCTILYQVIIIVAILGNSLFIYQRSPLTLQVTVNSYMHLDHAPMCRSLWCRFAKWIYDIPPLVHEPATSSVQTYALTCLVPLIEQTRFPRNTNCDDDDDDDDVPRYYQVIGLTVFQSGFTKIAAIEIDLVHTICVYQYIFLLYWHIR